MTKHTSTTNRKPATEIDVRVLIVDDHELLRDGLVELLGNRPFTTVCGEAMGENEAINLVVTTHPNLVIVDLCLRQGDGISLVKRIKQIDTAIQVIVCSMHDERLYAERSFSAGASGYVPKQAPATEVLDAVSEVMAGRTYLSPLLSQRIALESASSETANSIKSLSSRELEVFKSVGNGMKSGEIAERLGVSRRTIDTYRERIKAKLELRSASELSRRAVEWVLLTE